MKLHALAIVVFTLAVLTPASVGFSAGDCWVPPADISAPVQLPGLPGSIELDGDLAEWRAAACVPMRSRSYTNSLRSRHEWRGPSDLGAEVYCGWTRQGLALAAVVTDDDVLNDRPGRDFWQKDCVEFFVDGRPAGSLMTEPYSLGAYQILVRPPVAGQPAAVALNPRDGQIAGIKVGGKRMSTGYAVELLVPWSAFPGFSAKSGSLMGLGFAVDDYDARDRQLVQPYQMSCGGVFDLWCKPRKLIKWKLVDRPVTSSDVWLGPQVCLDLPVALDERKPLPVSVNLGALLSARAGSVRVSLKDSAGKTVLERTARPQALPAPWQGSRAANVSLPSKGLGDGYHIVCAVVYDRRGKPVGTAGRAVLSAGHTLRGALRALERADIRRLSQSQPFKAAAYMGLGVVVERLKRGLEIQNLHEVHRSVREIEARRQVLEEGGLRAGAPGPYDLLELTADPEAQVVVQYPGEREGEQRPDQAWVTFYWGAVPLAGAEVRQCASSEAAARAAGQPGDWLRVASGSRLISVRHPSRQVSEMVARLVAAGQPVRPMEVDRLRAEVVKYLGADRVQVAIPDGMSIYCGDLHMHSFYSDGTPSPAGLILQTMYCFMDFAAVTDHDRIDGALELQRFLARSGFDYPCIVGEEITMDWAHMNAYPLTCVIPRDRALYPLVRAAHSQGAVIQWNHPHAVDSPWMREHLMPDIASLGIDAWEHVPAACEQWKKDGTMPVVVGTSDTHDGTFSYTEQTAVLAPAPWGEDVAEAVRCGRAAAIATCQPPMVCGSEVMVSALRDALAEGKTLKAAKARQIRNVLRNADIAGLLRASPSSPEAL